MKTTPLWLFTGPEIGEKNEALKKLQEATRKKGALDIHSYYASDIKIGEIVSILQNGSLFADIRFVVLKNAEEIKKKEDIDLIITWMQETGANQEACLVLISDEISIDKRIESIVPKQNKCIFWEMFENKKEQWIYAYFKREGLSITPDAVAVLLELVENNTDALRSVCAQLVLYFSKGYTVSEDDVETLLAHTKEESPFSLFDALVQNKFESVLEIYRKISLSKNSSSAQLIAGLTYCFRRLGHWHSIQKNGFVDDQRLKQEGFRSKRMIEQYRRAEKQWDFGTTNRILALLSYTDLHMRRFGTTMQELLMEICLYAVCKKQGYSIQVPDYL